MNNLIVTMAMGITGDANIKLGEPMSAHTTFRVGGPAELYARPQDEKQLISLIKLFHQAGIQYCIVGNGSNLLVGDRGIDGAVIEIGKGLSNIDVDDDRIKAQSGVLLSRLAASAANNGLAGLEFASGIPGSLGGAVYMNAGAYGGEMKDVVTSVTYLDEQCEVETIDAEKCDFSYRHSVFTDSDKIILSAEMKLTPDDPEKIRERMSELAEKRKAKQPIDKPSAGSTFKRPAGYYAAALIEEAGLKGYSVGGAAVSEKHSGFVVNNGGATAEDVMAVIDHVIVTVMQKSGVTLEPEVKIIGKF